MPLRGTTTIRQLVHTGLLRIKQIIVWLNPKRCNGRSRKKLLSKTVHLSALGCHCLSFGGNNFSAGCYSLYSGKA